MLLIYGLPIVLASSAALCGFYVLRLITTNKEARIDGDDRNMAAIPLTLFIPAIAAGSVIVPIVKEYQAMYGEFPYFLRLLWAWTLASFVFGLIIGWGFCRPTN